MQYPPLHHSKLFLLAVATSLAAFLDALDLSIVNVALPMIAGDLDVSITDGTWAISSYSVTNAIVILLAGFIARRFGEVRFFCASLFFFVIFSIACATAPSFHALVFFRLCMGVSAGALIPLSQSILIRSFPKQKRALALGIWSIFYLLAPLSGPIIGGYVSELLGWRWLFYINVPLGGFSLFVCWTLLRHRETEYFKTPFDYVGVILLVIGVSCLQIFLDLGNNVGWFQSHKVVLLSLSSLIAMTIFVIWNITAKHPIIDLSLYKIRNYSVMSALSFVTFIAVYAVFIVYPMWLETEMSYTPIWAGLALMPFALLFFVFAPLVNLLIEKLHIDLRIYLVASFLVFAISCYLSSIYTIQASFASLLLPRIIIGCAFALFCIPSSLMAIADVDHHRLPMATALYSFPRTLGGGIGASVGMSILNIKKHVFYDQLRMHITNYNPQVFSVIDILKGRGMSEDASFAWIYAQTNSQSVMLGVNQFFLMVAFGCVVMIFCTWFAKPYFVPKKAEVH